MNKSFSANGLSNSCQGSTLDLVLTDTENTISELLFSELQPLLPTDHHIVFFNIEYATQFKQSNKHKYAFDISKADLEGLCNHLLKHDFSVCYNSTDVESVCIWSVIKYAILHSMNLYIPKVIIRSHKHPK